MAKQVAKKITWVIKNFSSSQTEKIYSDQFIVGGCKWRLIAYPKGNNVDYLFLYLEVADYGSLSAGWRRHVRYNLNIVNQNCVKRSKLNEEQKWFDVRSPRWGHLSMFSLNEINAKDSGFLVNGELRIVAEINVLKVIGKLDVSEETSIIMETMDFNGFQLLPSQVDFVRNLFERFPDIASQFHLKNPNLRAGYMSLLLRLIETLRQSPHDLHKADLAEAYVALRSLTDAGFKVDWLEKKHVELSEKKKKEEAGENRIQKIKEELKGVKQKCLDLEAKLEKERSEVWAANAPLSFADVF